MSGTLGGVVRAGTRILWTIASERLRPCSGRSAPRCDETLLIFTRYPEAGTSKTRLIPALGPEGAARLQRWMTLHALATADRIAARRGTRCEIHFAGGDATRMGEMFGRRRDYRAQADGDLGQRMQSAIQAAMDDSARRVVVIGADCPALTPAHLHEAYSAMQSHDLVIGPSSDGGYYLIGCKRLEPALFREMKWGTGDVLNTTLMRARQAGLSVHQLPELNDIDEPGDLEGLDMAQVDAQSGCDTQTTTANFPTLDGEG